ncbi:hypothetical protein ACFL2Q_15745 [Thermodesulfobacteriota bacterium]
MTVDEIAVDARRIRDEGFSYGTIIVDDDGNIRPSQGDTLYLEGGVTYGTLEKLARDTESILLVGCQPRRDYWDRENIPLDVEGESSKKAHIVDMMACLTLPDKTIPVGYLQLPKVRRGATERRMRVCYLNSFASIIEINGTEKKQIKGFCIGSDDLKAHRALMDFAKPKGYRLSVLPPQAA